MDGSCGAGRPRMGNPGWRETERGKVVVLQANDGKWKGDGRREDEEEAVGRKGQSRMKGGK